MKISTQALLLIVAVAAACGGSGPTETITPEQTSGSEVSALPADDTILAKAYDSSYSVPDGFFVDERAGTSRSYTAHHVLDDSNSFEVCSDDLVEAQALEDADNRSRAVSGYYVTSRETDRYYEFVRELTYSGDVGNISDPTSPGYARVFKCAHTNRNGVDRNLLNGYSGRIDPQRLDATTLRDFTEYLWQFRFFNTTHRKVLSSYGSIDAPVLQHTLLLALVYNQGQDSCDRIDVVEWRFRADRASGNVSREFATVRSLRSTLTGAIPTICD